MGLVRSWALLGLLAAATAHANHPLLTEDTQVLGAGRSQFELHGTRGRDAGTRHIEASVVLSHGFFDRADVELELPYERVSGEDGTLSGRADASLSVKWRFYEAGGFSLLFRPDVYAPTGRDELGFGAGRWRWGANLVAAYETGRWEFLGQAGYLDNRNTIGERTSLTQLSAALLYSVTSTLTAIVDYARSTSPDPAHGAAAREIVYGLIYLWSKDLELAAGLQKGLNEPAADRGIRAGIQLRW